jgi:HlyD family secretion protein
MRLQKTAAQANSELFKSQLRSSLALEARLIAEREEKDTIAWPPEFANSAEDPALAKLVEDETARFDERRASIKGQFQILEAKIEQLNNEIQGIQIEKNATEGQVKYINEELVSLRRLLSRQLVPANRVFAMERERTRLEGVIGKTISDTARAQAGINEMRVQIAQIKQKFHEEVANALLEVRQKIADYRQRIIVAQDVLRRIDVIAPRAGTVQNLRVFTVGQVVRSGESLLDIVPDDERLIVEAQISTTDIDSVHEGQKAEIRFPAFHSRTLPVMTGVLESISRDRMVDEGTKQAFYRAIISISKADITEEYRSRLQAGMPAEVIVSGGERTALDYFVSPLASSLRKTFIEQ